MINGLAMEVTMSGDSGGKREWRVLETVGPVMSHGGFKNWHLCLAKDGIVAVPVGMWPSILAGIGAGIGMGPDGAYAKPSDVERERILVDDGNRRWRRYPVGEIKKVFVKWCLVGANEIHLQLVGQKNHVYGLGDRGQTKACRQKLRELFPEVYSEKGFEKVS
jgi:hypothetical protein